jgi:hypothetical protein
MPHLEPFFLQKLKADYKTFPNFIETGTFLGQTIFIFEPLFNNLYTIEIKEDLFKQAKERYVGNKINFYHGDSSEVLKEILPEISNKSIIFLDAHWSCGNTGRGVKDVPLYEELTSIVTLHKDELIIIVDDVRLFGKGPNTDPNILVSWEDINIKHILNICETRITDKYLLPSDLSKNDRLVIHLASL